VLTSWAGSATAIGRRLRLGRVRSEVTVYVAAVCVRDDDDHPARLFDLVDDPIVSGPDPVEVLHAFELQRTGRAGGLAQAENLGVNPS